MGCAFSSSPSPRKREQRAQGYEEPAVLAAETSFTVNEVEALYELYKKLSFSIFKDGLIHKEEFRLALFRTSRGANLFADRVFDLFDLKRNGVIEFGEFLREMVVALLDESDLCLSDSAVEEIVHNTFSQADSDGDGRIDPKEWEEFVKKNPASLRNMSLPYLQDITTTFPSFVMHSEVEDYSGISK
ncbi:Calcineurin B-like protein 4 [Triticum urartu]|uniref:Calcineurin B-like protein n=2 Tax=Triticum TaxID=4564 RepID=A0A9R0QFZ3_TRITD|nr:Calcineurin B-like protein 4 [Triticum urartu]VAH09703.1 unnamed protein product [Triticum turgidum subsp. durum]